MIFSESDRESMARSIRFTYPVAGEVNLKFGNCLIRVQSNSGAAIAGLKQYFNLFVTTDTSEPDRVISAFQADDFSVPVPLTEKMPDPGKTRIKEEYADIAGGRIVRKRLTGMVFLFGGTDHIALGPCIENLNQVINFINNRYIEWRLNRNGLLGHAAGIRLHDRGLALAGFSGMGKSTLALHLVSRGADFISNDRLVFENTQTRVWMHGVAKLPRVNPGTILNNPDLKGLLPESDYRRFSALSRDELWSLEFKYDVPIDRFFGRDHFILSTPLAALIILNWKQTGQPAVMRRVHIEDRRDLLPAFMKSTGLFFLPDNFSQTPDPTESAYIELLKESPVFEISGGVDFEAAARACFQWTLTGEPQCS